MPLKQDPVNKEWLYKEIIVNGNPVTKAFCKRYGFSLVKNTYRQNHHFALCEKAPIDISGYDDVQISSIHKKSAAVTKNYMKKESRERGNGADSEDVGTDSNSSDEDGSNQVPVLSNALAGTSFLPSTSGSSVPTPLVCSSSVPLPYLTKVAQQPKLACIQKYESSTWKNALLKARLTLNKKFRTAKQPKLFGCVPMDEQILDWELIVNYVLVTDKALFLESVEAGYKQHTLHFVAHELERAAKVWCPAMTGDRNAMIVIDDICLANPSVNKLNTSLLKQKISPPSNYWVHPSHFESTCPRYYEKLIPVSAFQETVRFWPVSKANERKIQKYIENSRIFAYDPTLAPATLLAPLFGANSLTQN
ncbi:hypothetical protein QYM36_001576, partial [Artemia franciscana]